MGIFSEQKSERVSSFSARRLPPVPPGSIGQRKAQTAPPLNHLRVPLPHFEPNTERNLETTQRGAYRQAKKFVPSACRGRLETLTLESPHRYPQASSSRSTRKRPKAVRCMGLSLASSVLWSKATKPFPGRPLKSIWQPKPAM